MLRIPCLAAVVLVVLAMSNITRAQDVQGIELCTRETQMDRRTGCMQSNIEYLQRLIAKNSADTQQKLNAAGAEISALKAEVARLKSETVALKGTLAAERSRVDKLQADAAKRAAPPDKPPAK